MSVVELTSNYYPKRVCPLKPAPLTPEMTNASFNECVMHCQQQDNCSLFDFVPNPDGNRGVCGNFRPMEAVVDADADNAFCRSYQSTTNVVGFDDYEVQTGEREIRSIDPVTFNPVTTRSFTIPENSDPLEVCKTACLGPTPNAPILWSTAPNVRWPTAKP